MKLDRAIDIQNELESRIIDLISSAKIFQLTHAQMCKRYNALFERYPKDLPYHVRSFASGYFRALLNNLYHADLTHGYLYQGTVYSKWDTYPEELKAILRGPTDTIPHGHFWTASLANKENKPFFANVA